MEDIDYPNQLTIHLDGVFMARTTGRWWQRQYVSFFSVQQSRV